MKRLTYQINKHFINLLFSMYYNTVDKCGFILGLHKYTGKAYKY